MTPDAVGQLAHQALLLAILISAPLVGAAALVGMFFGLMQALTQLQDQTTMFAVKLIVVLGLMLVLMPWMSELATHFGNQAFEAILEFK